MARFTQNRMRCWIDPGKKNQPFKDILNNSTTLVAFKDCGFALEFAVGNGASLYDIANVASISLLVADAEGEAVIPVKTLTNAELNNALTLTGAANSWDNVETGEAHGVFEITDEEGNVADGDYEVTVFGFTQKGREVFGVSKLKMIDRKITDYIPAPVPGPQYATTADLRGFVEQCVKYGKNPAGKTFTLVSRNGLKGRKHGTNNDGSDMNEPQDL